MGLKTTTNKSYMRMYVSVEVSSITCYFRHLNEVFKKAGIEVTRQNKLEVDKVIHNIVGVEYKNCPAAWKEVKKRLAEDEEAFVSRLREDVRKALKVGK